MCFVEDSLDLAATHDPQQLGFAQLLPRSRATKISLKQISAPSPLLSKSMLTEQVQAVIAG
jgi:hypothetical protein